MKILFIKNVSRQGSVGEVKDVPQGFATFLLQNGSAVVATDGVVKQNAKKIEEAKLKAKGEESMCMEMASRIDGKTFTIKGGANQKGSLYKAIHKQDVIDALSKEIVVTIPDSLLEDINIKHTGKHPLNAFYKDKKIATFEIEII